MKFSLKNKATLNYLYTVLALICTFWFISSYELYLGNPRLDAPHGVITLGYKLLNDFWSGFIIGILCFPIFILINIIREKVAFIVISMLFVLLVILQFALVKYSLTTLINLGADILGYSYDDIFSTVSGSEPLSVIYFLPFILFVILFYLINFLIKTYSNTRFILVFVASLLVVLGALKLILPNTASDTHQNKTAYLVKDIIKFQSEKSKLNAFNTQDRNDFPLLKPFNNEDVLSPFIEAGPDKPNIVVMVVEGLGGEFINGNTYSGFTPYLDELASKSLFWENFVSTTGRSFGILPSLFGSLPYGEKGFMELKKMPSHHSLISILKGNGYYTSYISGDASSFDRKINFLEYNGIDTLVDESNFGDGYAKTKGNSGGFSWGYPDSEIFKKAIASMDVEKQPRLDIIMTLSNHEPFEFPGKDIYMEKVDRLLNNSKKPEALKNEILNHKAIFGSLLYTDDAIKNFMESYSKRPDYANTIFIITGDHRLIPIEQKDKLCRFHVPLLIYSPMLKKAESFKSVSSHWDVTPSLLSYLTHNYKFKPLKKTAWMGKGLDTVKHFRNVNSIPLMRYKGNVSDMIYKDYFINNKELFKITENFGTYKVTDEALVKTISDSLFAFKKMNAYVTQRNKIFPDSLNIYVTAKFKFSEAQQKTINRYTKGKTFDETLLIARDLAFNKKYKTAQLLCDYILNEYPNYSDAIILKGRTLAWQHDYTKAEKQLLNALKCAPYYDDAYLALLDLYWWSNQENKSIAIYQKALENKVINPEISFKMAEAYFRMENKNEAKKIMDSITKTHPDNSEYSTFKQTLK
ncbi:sulfatase-like hydrolase/transferase [Mariniflexile sp. AS56]|uniref:sulfatase-like hydrolase/transferase n=1 Tax=Mariniflexile sp. AS56 TaxID=3063957 RepID=UPI0026EFD631|nr:sulfatase-like hydrolase/transferase [Mariniflexile sp. AS56]MDO7173260.1 sulfatase-like hydrolase/transferase [Mariniflexile sp. AS56]